MIFTNLARLIAFLGAVFGALQILMGVSIAEEWMLPYREAMERYAPGSKTSGEIVDRGIYIILIAVVMGTLAEISLALQKR
jgi:hypothetical protein